jgi:hypothetical protein
MKMLMIRMQSRYVAVSSLISILAQVKHGMWMYESDEMGKMRKKCKYGAVAQVIKLVEKCGFIDTVVQVKPSHRCHNICE